MVLKTLHFVQGLSRTPLLFIPRHLTNIVFKNKIQKQSANTYNLESRKSENLEIQKPRFTNRCPARGQVFSGPCIQSLALFEYSLSWFFCPESQAICSWLNTVSLYHSSMADARWAPVSEPGFLDFQISRFSSLKMFYF